MTLWLHRCRAGFEPHLVAELALHGCRVSEQGACWVLGPVPDSPPAELCFAWTSQSEAELAVAPSVNALAALLVDRFAESTRGETFVDRWPLIFEAAGIEGLIRRARAVERRFKQLLRRRMSRLVRLAHGDTPLRPGIARGLFVTLVDFDRAYHSRECTFGGQRRMRLDPGAPSRSYLKLEEAFAVLGREPRAGQTVVDLGAAPGGWSFSAAKRGARVVAVDNGVLKGAARDLAGIEHVRADAFTYQPRGGHAVDWLLCDVLENPQRILTLVRAWLDAGWCRNFVANLKFGRGDAIALLEQIGDPVSGFGPLCRELHARQLYHDREEFTLMGSRAG